MKNGDQECQIKKDATQKNIQREVIYTSEDLANAAELKKEIICEAGVSIYGRSFFRDGWTIEQAKQIYKYIYKTRPRQLEELRQIAKDVKGEITE